MKEIPDYRKTFGSIHESFSNGNIPKDQWALKLYLRKEHNMSYPNASRMWSGTMSQLGADYHLGLNEYSPIDGQQEGVDVNQAVRHAISEYNNYEPRNFDDGKDKEEFEEFREHLPNLIRNASEGIKEFFSTVNQIEGEFQILHDEPRIDIPVMLYQDYSGGGRQLDLKCHMPLRNPPKKDGTRTWRIPKPYQEPRDSWIKQQAVYWKATKQKPALLSVTPSDYHIISEENCELLQEDNLEIAYNEVVKSWEVSQNLLKASRGSWKTLASLIQPDFNEIARLHGPQIVKIAKQLWEY